MDFLIAPDDPGAPDVRALLGTHLRFAGDTSPPEHVHALDASGLADPAVSLFAARRGKVLLGVGALKELDAFHGEIKSMHTDVGSRRQGVGRAMVEHLLSVAAGRGYRQVSLETGTVEAFAPARSLYTSAGFISCEPFAQYSVNPWSTCLTIELTRPRGGEAEPG
jgi:putative acetyltransferase